MTFTFLGLFQVPRFPLKRWCIERYTFRALLGPKSPTFPDVFMNLGYWILDVVDLCKYWASDVTSFL